MVTRHHTTGLHGTLPVIGTEQPAALTRYGLSHLLPSFSEGVDIPLS